MTTISTALKQLKLLVDTGKFPLLDRPEAYSELLCRYYLPEKIRGESNAIHRIEENFPWYGGRGDYPKTFKQYMKIVAPTGLFAARGLHGLPITTVNDVKFILNSFGNREQESKYDTDNYSMNVAYASANFTAIKPRVNRRYVEYFIGNLESSAIKAKKSTSTADRKAFTSKDAEKLAKGKDKESIDHYQQFRAAKLVAEVMSYEGANKSVKTANEFAAALLSSMLIVAKIQPKYLRSFGGDSESGPLLEAEVWADPQCSVTDCAQHIFVLCPFKLALPRATTAERKKYCLSYYQEWSTGEWYNHYLHPSVKCKDRIVASKFKMINKVPSGFTWYKFK